MPVIFCTTWILFLLIVINISTLNMYYFLHYMYDDTIGCCTMCVLVFVIKREHVYCICMYCCCVKACEKWRADAECCTTMMSRLSEERQQALQQLDEVGRTCRTCMTTLILCLVSPGDMLISTSSSSLWACPRLRRSHFHQVK